MTATTTVESTVIRLIPDFELVEMETDAGDSLMFGRQTQGVSWQELHHGQRLKCQVEGDLTPRVLSAERLEALVGFLKCTEDVVPKREHGRSGPIHL